MRKPICRFNGDDERCDCFPGHVHPLCLLPAPTNHKQTPRVSERFTSAERMLRETRAELAVSRARIAELEAENARLRQERDAAWRAASLYVAAQDFTPPSEDRQDG